MNDENKPARGTLLARVNQEVALYELDYPSHIVASQTERARVWGSLYRQLAWKDAKQQAIDAGIAVSCETCSAVGLWAHYYGGYTCERCMIMLYLVQQGQARFSLIHMQPGGIIDQELVTTQAPYEVQCVLEAQRAWVREKSEMLRTGAESRCAVCGQWGPWPQLDGNPVCDQDLIADYLSSTGATP